MQRQGEAAVGQVAAEAAVAGRGRVRSSSSSRSSGASRRRARQREARRACKLALQGQDLQIGMLEEKVAELESRGLQAPAALAPSTPGSSRVRDLVRKFDDIKYESPVVPKFPFAAAPPQDGPTPEARLERMEMDLMELRMVDGGLFTMIRQWIVKEMGELGFRHGGMDEVGMQLRSMKKDMEEFGIQIGVLQGTMRSVLSSAAPWRGPWRSLASRSPL